MHRKRHKQNKTHANLEAEFTEYMNDSMDFSYRIAKRFFKHQQQIQDVIQAAYLKSWLAFDGFDPDKAKFTTWFFTILRNECLDQLRKANNYYSEDINEAAGNLEESGISYEGDDLIRNIIALAERLPPQQKEIFLLRDIMGYSNQEIAKQIQISPGSVKSNLHHARKSLRSWIHEEELI